MTTPKSDVTHALLVYDVPDKNTQLAGKLRERIRKIALRVNLSVYLFRWEDKHIVEGVVAEVRDETGQTCSARILAQSPEATQELLLMGREASGRMLDELFKGLRLRIDRAPELIEKQIAAGKLDPALTKKARARRVKVIIKDVKKRVEEIGRLALFLQISDDIRGFYDTVQDLLKVEGEALDRLQAEIASGGGPVAAQRFLFEKKSA
jgi:hypothetical protein